MPRDVRAERNAQLFREVNERIDELEAGWVSGEPIGFVCECGEIGCRVPVYLTVAEFREIREASGRHVVVPDHVDPLRDRVVASSDRYAIVEPREPRDDG